jgi:hypothetical protein
MSAISAGLVSGVVANATVTEKGDSPYDGIAERNLFNLHAAPMIAQVPTSPTVARPKITLTGITTILGMRMAFITVADIKPGRTPESLMLTEGQRVNDIEVKSIDEKAGVVQVMNHGELQILEFESAKAFIPQPGLIIDRAPRPAPPPTQLRAEVPLSLEEQMALIEIQRIKLQSENNPMGQILPPTEMAPE